MTQDPAPPASPDLPLSLPFRVATLPGRSAVPFDLKPGVALRAAIAQTLGLIELPKFRFKGEIRPLGRSDFELVAQLTADVVQPCSVTLVPVPAHLSEQVERRYLADFALPQEPEAEIPEDDAAEPLPSVIDAGAVAIEALALALPLYPRAEGVELGEAVFAPPGAEPLRDADLRPFAGLGALKSRLDGEGGNG